MRDQTWLDIINQKIQKRLTQSAMVYKVVELRNRSNLDMEIIVDDKIYQGLADVKDQAVRTLIQTAIDEWQEEADPITALSSSRLLGLTSSLPVVKLWTPRVIGFVTFFLGFPGGIVLASLNWLRMGQEKKAVIHLVGGTFGVVMFLLTLLILPGNIGRYLGMGVNFGLLIYLQQQMRKDIKGIAGKYSIQNANWLWGSLIGLICLGLFLAANFVFTFFLVTFGVSIPE